MSGYGALLHLDSATHSFVEEFSTSAFLGHKKNKDGRSALVVPGSDGAIDSTTSRTLADLAQRGGWIIERSRVSQTNPLSSIATSISLENYVDTDWRVSSHSSPSKI
jgi:hypothetical protein